MSSPSAREPNSPSMLLGLGAVLLATAGCIVEAPAYSYLVSNGADTDAFVRISNPDPRWLGVASHTWGHLVDGGGATQPGWTIEVFNTACEPLGSLAMAFAVGSLFIGPRGAYLHEGADWDPLLEVRDVARLDESPCPGR